MRDPEHIFYVVAIAWYRERATTGYYPRRMLPIAEQLGLSRTDYRRIKKRAEVHFKAQIAAQRFNRSGWILI